MECKEVELDVFLVNGKKTSLKCFSSDRTDDILEVCYKVPLSNSAGRLNVGES